MYRAAYSFISLGEQVAPIWMCSTTPGFYEMSIEIFMEMFLKLPSNMMGYDLEGIWYWYKTLDRPSFYVSNLSIVKIKEDWWCESSHGLSERVMTYNIHSFDGECN